MKDSQVLSFTTFLNLGEGNISSLPDVGEGGREVCSIFRSRRRLFLLGKTAVSHQNEKS